MQDFRISTNQADLDVSAIHRFLSGHTTWAKDIPLSVLQRAIDNSLCFGGFLGASQVAFARVITDYATFAYLVDVYVLPEHRGKGFGKRLIAQVLSHPQLQGLRRFTLATSSAHGLYAQLGFTAPMFPQTLMERYSPNIYSDGGT